MQTQNFFIALLTSILIFSCHPLKEVVQITDDGIIDFVFLQANDVYEITPLQGGAVGGLARMATVKKQLLKENKNTFTVHAGDFLNPSLIGTLKYDGERIKGRQMVEVMNAVGFDMITFGNHEFDLDEEDLQKRLNESEFAWTSCNTFQICGDRTYPFYREKNGRKEFFPETYTWEISDDDGTTIRIGIFGVTLDDNQPGYVHYLDVDSMANVVINELSTSADVVIGLTHLNVKDDIAMAQRHQNVPLFMGGHDHDNQIHQVGNSVVAKADANVKTVYIHRMRFNKNTGEVSLESELKNITDQIPEDPKVKTVVDKWSKILMEKVGEIIAEPNKIIMKTDVPLDGRESSIRHKQTNLGEVVTRAMYESWPGLDGAFVNSGSIRIDDQIHGSVTPIDFFRALPYGGKVIRVEMTGDLLREILESSVSRPGNGAYLQRYRIDLTSDGDWKIGGRLLMDKETYTIAMNDFLLKGYDFKFLTESNEGLLKVDWPEKGDRGEDIRLAIVKSLENR